MISDAENEGSALELQRFLAGKSAHTLLLFHHFIDAWKAVGPITVLPAKTMIGIATPRKRVVYITQLGKNFVHVVFPFKQRYDDNLCFQKIAQVPGDVQCNHHLRIFLPEDVNEEVLYYMRLAYNS
ncbi:DUF5655 domain-containing protein [uncultured Mucilaginibacter sp.]|uniref:DUF5655 domain-containing protein n=1 Tax=uncultured Mucilaginibacter sp. TaxID=797541 RepID=UPI0025E1C2B1|nr:DUF5655 domain-containing protein [uncultured Mucilaginibacter sp.]